VEKFVLPNGLRLLVCRDPRLPLVSIYAGFRSGLLAENPKNNGITRLLSRALLKGTTTRSAEEIAESIEGVGGRIAADSGNNSFAVTTSVMKGDLALALDVVADVLTNPAFPAEEVELERAAQVAAIKAEDEQITAVARNVAREKLFGDHPYALRASGRTDTVATITRDDLVAFHKEAATARNGVVAVFGDVDPAQVRALAEKAFAKMPEGRLLLTDAPLPHPLKEEVNITEHRDKQQAVVMVGYPGADVLSKDRVALELIEEASNDLGSRFFNRIREKLGLAYFVGAGNFLGLVPGSFLFYLGTDPLKVDKVTSEFTDEIQKLAEGGLTDEELTRAKKKLLGAEAIRTQSTPEFAARTAVDELVGLGYDRAAGRRAEVEAVTLEDVRRVAAKYFNQPGRVLAVVTPATNSATN
jgi:zinc protease